MVRITREDSGGLWGDSLDVGALCKARGWSRSRLIGELRRLAAVEGRELPGNDSMLRMIRLWANGTRQPSAEYAALLARAFGVLQPQFDRELVDDFVELLDRADSAVDEGTVVALETHTQSLRILDRRLGAHRVLGQAEAHARVVADLVRWAPFGRVRSGLAAAAAEAAALAGWQALDLGRPTMSWTLHGHARALAHESGDPSVIAHVTAQQAYVLLDSGRVIQAVAHVEGARRQAGTRVSGMARAWLAVLGHQVGDSRLVGGSPPSALWRRSVL